MSTLPSTKSTTKDLVLGQPMHPALANDMVIITVPLGMIKEPDRKTRKFGKRAIATTKAITS